jgi:hypothetical protein
MRDLRELRAAEAVAQFTATNKAVVTLVGNQHSVASVRGFSVVQDEPTSVAGGMRGPTPTDYFMVSLGTCQNVIFVRYAALEDRPPDAPRLSHLRHVTQGDRVYDSAHREWAWRALLT